MDPMSAFLTLRGLRTLDLRIQRQNENAMKIAGFLETQNKIKAVHIRAWPPTPIMKSPDVDDRFGGMLSFEIDADFNRTKCFMDHL